MGVGFGGICMKIPTAIQASSKLYYFVLHAPRRLYYHMKTWAPSPLALPLNERGGQRDVGVIFSSPWYLRRSGTLNITLILVVHQSTRAHAPTQLSPEPALPARRRAATPPRNDVSRRREEIRSLRASQQFARISRFDQ